MGSGRIFRGSAGAWPGKADTHHYTIYDVWVWVWILVGFGIPRPGPG